MGFIDELPCEKCSAVQGRLVRLPVDSTEFTTGEYDGARFINREVVLTGQCRECYSRVTLRLPVEVEY